MDDRKPFQHGSSVPPARHAVPGGESYAQRRDGANEREDAPRGEAGPRNRRDDADAVFPRGFATTWTRARRADINEYDVFAESLAKAKREAAEAAKG